MATTPQVQVGATTGGNPPVGYAQGVSNPPNGGAVTSVDSPAPMVPMISPDGRSGDIPANRVAEAQKAGFKPAYAMTSPDGQTGYVPDDQYQNAVAKGFKLNTQPGVRVTGTNGAGQPIFGPEGAPAPGLGDIFNTDMLANTGNSALQGIENFARAAASSVGHMAAHPLNAIENAAMPYLSGALTPAGAITPQAWNSLDNTAEAMAAHPAYAAGKIAGPIIAGVGVSDVAPIIGEPIGRGATAVREAALGDADAAALRGLHVSPQSPKAIQTLNAVEGARPFLQGSQNLADVQARIPDAKAEIWEPYQNALNKIGGRQVKGPDGAMTTVQTLEDRRLELSAQLRTLRKGGPEAIQLAQQKGLTQANLLREDSQIRSVLDPQLRQAGIDPAAIRKAFSQVAQVGSRVAGKTTTGEASQPFGFSRLADIDIRKPLSNIGTTVKVARDIAAGRYRSQIPTDMNIREAFRPSVSGPKPNFAALPSRYAGLLERGPIQTPPPADTSGSIPYQPPPVDATTRAVRLGRLLPAQTGGPIELPYVPEMTGGEQLAALLHYLRNNKPPKGLPAKSSPIRLPASK